MVADIVGAFAQFAAPDLNAFKYNQVQGRELEQFTYRYAFRLFDARQSIELSSEELTSIWHFPVSSAILPRVRYKISKRLSHHQVFHSKVWLLAPMIITGK